MSFSSYKELGFSILKSQMSSHKPSYDKVVRYMEVSNFVVLKLTVTLNKKYLLWGQIPVV